ncbi:TINAL protein, partial [Atractosteus spatula]|nr:TINAL protein [Atractosteus spatula]
MRLLLITVGLLLMVEVGIAKHQVRTRRQLNNPLHSGGIQDPYGSYCKRRGGCCPGRDDQCTVPYLDTICYCDLFCNRTVSDCCPDFWRHCLGIPPPIIFKSCERNGHRFHPGATHRENCNLWSESGHSEAVLSRRRGAGQRETHCDRGNQEISCDDSLQIHCSIVQHFPLLLLQYTVANSPQQSGAVLRACNGEVMSSDPITCSRTGQWDCEQHVCLVEPDMIHAINRGNYGWYAGNYSQFWGMTLDEGIRYRLGTQLPSRSILSMNELKMNMDSSERLPPYFRAEEKWPGKIHEPLDQGNCAASWAFSTAAVASDRIAIQSMGHMTPQLSPQNIISCDTRNQGGCTWGRVDGAWWFLRRKGVVTQECYPFLAPQPGETPHCMMHSRPVGRGKRQATAHCPSAESYRNEIYQSTPPYRLSSNEKEIMKEIMDNGPVQAIMEVHEDFFVYQSGIYRHTPVSSRKAPQYRKHGTHSVRITGVILTSPASAERGSAWVALLHVFAQHCRWGEERDYNGQTRKYWIAANSWGRNWGEDGYFKITRGENECQIETFIIGVWGRVTMEDMHHHHRK